jgi:ATP dependent DNA ligase domain
MLRNRVTPAGFVRPCQPSPVVCPPAGSGWFHEIKHDGIRLLVRRENERVRAFTRNGNDWAARYPAIVAAAAALRARSFLIDGEAVVADGDEVSFLKRRKPLAEGCGRNPPFDPQRILLAAPAPYSTGCATSRRCRCGSVIP